MGQGGGGLLGGSGLVLEGADGDGWGDSECCKLCLCAAQAGIGGGFTVGRTEECLDLGGPVGLARGLA